MDKTKAEGYSLDYRKMKKQEGKAISPEEEDLIVRLHKLLGDRWTLIAGRLPWRTKEEIQAFWQTRSSRSPSYSSGGSSNTVDNQLL